jgi:hypothetical protein
VADHLDQWQGLLSRRHCAQGNNPGVSRTEPGIIACCDLRSQCSSQRYRFGR